MYLQLRWKGAVSAIRGSESRNPMIDDVVQFVKEAADEANDPVYGKLADSNRTRTEPDRQGNQTRVNRGAALATSVQRADQEIRHTADSNRNCLMCADSHSLFNCQTFKNLSVDDRQDFVKLNKLCYNCLRGNHRSNACKLTRVCTVTGCGKKHTRLLHKVSAQVPSNPPPGSGIAPSQNWVCRC